MQIATLLGEAISCWLQHAGYFTIVVFVLKNSVVHYLKFKT